MESFNLFPEYIGSLEGTRESTIDEEYVGVSKIGGKFLVERKVWLGTEVYYAYHVFSRDTVLLGRETNLTAKKFPNLVKVQCANVFPQILNSEYSTDLICFCPDFEKESVYYFHEFTSREGTLTEYNLIIPNDVYTEDKLIQKIKDFLIENQIGDIEKTTTERIKLDIKKNGWLQISKYLAKILGYHDILDEAIDNVILSFTSATNEKNEYDFYSLTFRNETNMEYLQPNYIMIYANFISSTIIGGEYVKIFRIIPIKKNEMGYIISDFKHKIQLQLQNSDITEVHVELRTHDGAEINFSNQKDVILNVEFANFTD